MAKSKLQHQRFFPLLLIGLVGLLVMGGAIYNLWLPQQPSARSSGTALIGGPFSLIDGKGQTVTERDFLGHYTLVIFGYSSCPDICPTELQVVANALASMGQGAVKPRVVFVTVDPARDTAQLLQEYVTAFDPDFQAFTGSPEAIDKMAKAYRVYYARVENAQDPAHYTMDHTSIMYLMGPDGKFVKHFPYTTDAASLAMDLTQAIAVKTSP